MLIAQITDLHIGTAAHLGLNADRLTSVVNRLNEIRPDLVLATGDLCEKGSPADYELARDLLAPLAAPLLPVIGNHDERHAFRAAFDPAAEGDSFLQYVRDLSGRRIIVLDTVEAGQHGGAFCDARQAWLEQRLDEAPHTPTLIALHHPPVRSGIEWMDAGVDGPWSRRLNQALSGRQQVVGLVAGHLHRPMTTRFAGHPLIVASSCAPQVVLDLAAEGRDGPRAPRARIIDEAPGFVLHLWTDGGLTSHFAGARDNRVIARFDPALGRIVPA